MIPRDKQIGAADPNAVRDRTHANASRLNARYDSMMADASPERSLLAFGLTLREDIPLDRARRIIWAAPPNVRSAEQVEAHIANALASGVGRALH